MVKFWFQMYNKKLQTCASTRKNKIRYIETSLAIKFDSLGCGMQNKFPRFFFKFVPAGKSWSKFELKLERFRTWEIVIFSAFTSESWRAGKRCTERVYCIVHYSFFKSRKRFWELRQRKRFAKQSIFMGRKAGKWLRSHVANFCVLHFAES